MESSFYLAISTNNYLTALANQDHRLCAEELEQVRENLTVIANNLAGDLDVGDPRRLSSLRENVDCLLQYLDDYPLEP